MVSLSGALLLVSLQCAMCGAVDVRRTGAGASAGQSPGAIIVRRLVDLKEQAARDMRQSGDAWGRIAGTV